MGRRYEDRLSACVRQHAQAGATGAFSGILWAASLLATGCAGTGAPGGSGPEARPQGRFRLPPVVWLTREPSCAREVRNFLGFLYHQVAESRPPDGSPPVEGIVSRSSLDLLWPLYHRESVVRSDGRRVQTRRLAPIFWARHETEESGAGHEYSQFRMNVLGIVLSLRSDNYGGGELEYSFLWPLGHYFRGERPSRDRGREFAQTFRFLPFVGLERVWRPEKRSLYGRSGPTPGRGAGSVRDRPPDRVQLRVVKPLFGYDRDSEQGKKRVYLVGFVSTGEETGKEHTWGLWAYEKGPSTDVEHQLLWRFFMFKRSGSGRLSSSEISAEKPSDLWRAVKWLFRGSPRRLLRVGPLVNFETDWEADRSEFSVLFGLLSYARKGRSRSGRLLWVIPWRAGR